MFIWCEIFYGPDYLNYDLIHNINVTWMPLLVSICHLIHRQELLEMLRSNNHGAWQLWWW